MYYVRIVFFVTNGYDLDIDEEYTLLQSESIICKVTIDRRLENVKVIISYGGFENEEIATQEGDKLFHSVKKRFVKNGIPINISGGLRVLDTTQKSFHTGGLTQYGLEHIEEIFPQLANKTVRNETLGLEIYQLDEDISEVKFIGQSAKITKKVKFPEIEIEEYKGNNKVNVAYSLLNSSNSINDLRASFLLKVSAIESLVSEDAYKEKIYCDIINQINRMIKLENIKVDLEIPNDEIQKIIQKLKGSIGTLKKKSIGEKCKDLILLCNLNKIYLNMDVILFFNECYRIRSKFVHTGTYRNEVTEIEKIRELEMYLNELNSLIIDILDYYEKNFI